MIGRIDIAFAVFAAILTGAVLTDPAFWLRYAGAQLGSAALSSLAARPREDIGEASPKKLQTQATEIAILSLPDEASLRALVVLKNGVRVAARYGNRTREATLLDGGALTQMLPLLAAGTLFADGAFPAYDESIGTWLPEFATPPRDSITLAHVLTQSSGISVPHVKIAPYASATQFMLGTDIDAALARLPLVAAPGTLRQNNPADAQLLLQTIERARGEDFARLIERRLWQPLGAGKAQFTRDAGGGRMLGYCCFAARAEDWARLGQLFVDRGRVGPLQLLPAQFLEDVGKPSAADPAFGMSARRIGMGPADRPVDLLEFRGEDGQFLWVSREAGLVVVAFFAPGASIDEQALLDRLLDALVGKATSPSPVAK